MVRLSIENFGGYINCKSTFGQYNSVLDDFSCDFDSGTTLLIGEIDSGGWALSYILTTGQRGGVISSIPTVLYDGRPYTLDDISLKVGYVDRKINIIDNQQSVKSIIKRNLKKSKLEFTVNQVQDIFQLSASRIVRPLRQVGNEFICAKAAIEFSSGKDIYCFPWLSTKQFYYYIGYIRRVCSVLESYKKITIIPTSAKEINIEGRIIEMPNRVRLG